MKTPSLARSLSFTRSLTRRAKLGLGALLVLTGCADPDSDSHHGDSAGPGVETALTSSSTQDLEQTLDELVAGGVAPGVALTVSNPSHETWSGASGVASLASGEALQASDRFRAGSMLKIAVATAVLQRVEHEELALDATLDALLDHDIAARIPNANAISVRMLLAHTSGIPDFADAAFDAQAARDPKHVWSFDELLDRALSQPALHAPGASYAYSNTGYILLGKVLEKTTGEPWRQSLRTNVFARAQLRHTELPEEGNVKCNGCAHGYGTLDGEALTDITEVDPSMAGAAGGDAMITTTEDLTTLMRALIAGRLFDEPGTLDLMLDFAPASVPEEAQTDYGLGLARFHAGDLQLIGHLGSAAGYQGFVFFNADTGVIASGYMNRTGDLGAFVLPALDAIARVQ